MTFQQFLEKWNGQPVDLLKVTKMRFMHFLMFRTSNYLKILNSVVRSISIYMVNYFFIRKESTNLFFHYKTMFSNVIMVGVRMMWLIKKNILTFMRNTTFPIVSKFSTSISTFCRTVLSFSYFIAFEFFTTSLTQLNTFTRKIIAFSATHSRLIRGWFFKLFSTPLTNKDHIEILPYTMIGVNYL